MSVEIATDSPTDPARLRELEREIARGSPRRPILSSRARRSVVAEVLGHTIPPHALRILDQFREGRRDAILAQLPNSRRRQWEINARHPDQSVGSLMVLPVGVFPPEMRIRDAIEGLREAVKTAFISYIHVTDSEDRLIGVVVMREMLLSDPGQALADIMIPKPFALQANAPVADAMHGAVQRHYPVYPVVDESGRLVGLVRGEDLFQQRVFQLWAPKLAASRRKMLSTRAARAALRNLLL